MIDNDFATLMIRHGEYMTLRATSRCCRVEISDVDLLASITAPKGAIAYARRRLCCGAVGVAPRHCWRFVDYLRYRMPGKNASS